MFNAVHQYDDAPRDGTKVFVGEWATRSSPTPNFADTLADAAWMTGLERNSDLILMAAYAPLLVNVNGMQWAPDLIGFDAMTSYGSPSYYAQCLFAAHLGDQVGGEFHRWRVGQVLLLSDPLVRYQDSAFEAGQRVKPPAVAGSERAGSKGSTWRRMYSLHAGSYQATELHHKARV